MPRNPMQDIVPKGKSIRNIPVPETRVRPVATTRKAPVKKKVPATTNLAERESVPRRKTINVLEKPQETEDEGATYAEPSIEDKLPNWEALQEVKKQFETPIRDTAPAIPENDYVYEEPPKKSKRKLGLTALIVTVLVVAFGLSSLFHSATVTVSPRTVSAAVDGDYKAVKSAAGAELAYQIITLKEIGTETVKATGERKVDRKAQGTIVIYNNYTTSPQRLVKNTRFQTPEGLIFRITESVTVPGKKGATPGSVEALVVADEAGDTYNVGLKDFTIPGFKGDPRYSSFYARSKTPLAGGFSGTEKVVAEGDRAAAKTAIETSLTTELRKRAATMVPEGKVAFADSYDLVFTALPEESSGSDVSIRSEGTLSLLVFDKQALSAEVAQTHIEGYNGDPIEVTNLATLTFEPAGTFDPVGSDTIEFSIKGEAVFEWQYDELSLKQALVGQPRADIDDILERFITIESADISLRPAWARTFPEELDKVAIRKAE